MFGLVTGNILQVLEKTSCQRISFLSFRKGRNFLMQSQRVDFQVFCQVVGIWITYQMAVIGASTTHVNRATFRAMISNKLY